jgi:O-antigen ligase
MIRLSILSLGLLSVWFYAFRDWMVSLCGLILLTVLMQNHNMPTSIAGIQGLNPWNITLAVVTLAWLARSHDERRPWNLSRVAMAVAVGYIGIIVLAYAQAMLQSESFPADFADNTAHFLTVDHLINPVKFLWAAFLLADGCTSRRRVRLAIGTLVGLGALYAIMVIKVMPLDSLVNGIGILEYRMRIGKQVGLHANTMAKVLTLTFWSLLATQRLWCRASWSKAAICAAYPITFFGMALCFSRAGYLTWAAVGLVLACVRWRKLLLFGPPGIVLVALFLSGVTERMSMGFDDERQEPGISSTNWNQVTAGRTGNLWPPILEEIHNAPLFGHGRLAILHTPAYAKIEASEGEVPVTPHNGYLEVMVDAGAVGLVVVLYAFIGTLILSYRLVKRSRDLLFIAVGALGLVHSVGCLVNALSGGTLFPDQGMLGSLCVFAIVLRVWFSRVPLIQRAETFDLGHGAWLRRSWREA